MMFSFLFYEMKCGLIIINRKVMNMICGKWMNEQWP